MYSSVFGQIGLYLWHLLAPLQQHEPLNVRRKTGYVCTLSIQIERHTFQFIHMDASQQVNFSV